MSVLSWLKSLPQASAVISRVMALFAKADLDFEALTAEGSAEDALQKLIAQRTASGVETATKALNEQVTALTGQVSDRDTQLVTVNSQLAASRASLATLITALKACGLELDASAPDPTAALRAALNEKIAAAAVERLAETGVPISEVPPQIGAEKSTRAELLAEFNAMTDPAARAKFYAQHRDALLT